MPENKIREGLDALLKSLGGSLEEIALQLFGQYKTKVDDLAESMAIGLQRHDCDDQDTCEAVGWAETAHGMAQGKEKDRFTGQPVPPMSRDEMALMLCAAINLLGHAKIAARQHDSESGQHGA